MLGLLCLEILLLKLKVICEKVLNYKDNQQETRVNLKLKMTK